MMNWNHLIENENIFNTIIAVCIFLVFLVFRKIFSKYFFKFILRIAKKTPTDFFTNIWLAFEKPLHALFVVIGAYVAAKYFPYINTKSELFMDIYRSSIIVLVTWGLYNLSSTSSAIFHKLNKQLHLEIDQILIPFLSKLLRIIIILISITVILQEFDYQIGGLLTGIGLGGLAISLAAQDAIKNFIGGLVIILEKPFSIGDWILTPGVEGTVEDISFRSTKVRTFDQALVTVPNSELAAANIKNFSKMGKRRIDFRLHLPFDTPPEKIDKVITDIRSLLKNHEEIHPETIFVTFDLIADNSFELFFYFFTNTSNWGEYLEVRQEINFKIMEILSSHGVKLAYPSQRLFVVNEPDSGRQKYFHSEG